MLTTKVVVRVMDVEHRLLGWTQVQAEARGDGCLWCPGETVVRFTEAGHASILSVHLADLHIEYRAELDVRAAVGGGVTLPSPLVRLGTPPAYLPPVTVGEPIAVAVPVGVMNARP
jgi:hypothetical protein